MWSVKIPLGDDSIQRYVPALRQQVRDVLEFVGDADQLGSPPAALDMQMSQAAIVEAGAAAETHAAVVERQQWHEYQVEMQGRDVLIAGASRFENAENVALDRKSVV